MDLSFSVFSWNIRGLGKNVKLRAISRVLESNKPGVAFFQESKVSEISVIVDRLLRGFIRRDLIFSPAVGASGGLITLWDRNVFQMTSKVILRRVVAVKGRLVFNNLEFGFVNVYGPNIHYDRSDFFEQLSWFTLPRSVSDHNPVVLKIRKGKKVVRPFKWFNHWAEDPVLVERIKGVWMTNRGKGILHSLSLTKAVTKERERSIRDSNTDSVEKIGNYIDDLEKICILNPSSSSAQNDLVAMKARLWALLRKEEREWLQKSRLKWFKECDRNTKFFHLTASSRARRNQISKLKVWFVINSSDGSRAPGPDGFNLNFFKKFWLVIKEDVMMFMSDFYWGRIEDPSFNNSFIALIPKTGEAVSPEDFRPISLVGSLYKIVSRVMAKRMGICIKEVVGENQFAFTSGKQIADCVLIANEVIDDLSKKKKKALLFKADFRKAYDSVDWNFLNLILKKMGFGKRWRKWVQFCISTSSIVVLVNGYPSVRFSIKRGLRQGCSLSPFLFNVVGEALSGMLKKVTDIGLCGNVGVGFGNTEITHIQIAYDLLIFSAANEQSLKNFKRVLKIFELAAGLKLNMSKSKIFGINVDDSRISYWANSINCGWDSLPTTYLGLPLGHKKNLKSLWQPVLDKGNSERAIHWLKWKSVCGPKSHGGVGIFDVQTRNRALLNKWFWRFSKDGDCLWKKIIVAKYNYSLDSIIPKEVNVRNSSWVWRNIVNPVASHEGNMSADFSCKMGNGEKIDFWNDRWSEMNSLKASFPRIFGLALKKSGNISEFGSWVNEVWEWKIELRRGLFEWENALWLNFMEVLNKAISSAPALDNLIWAGSADGRYSPKLFCLKEASAGKLEDPIWRAVWCKFVPPKVSGFVWKAVHQRLPVISELIKRGVPLSDNSFCSFCHRCPETINHIMIQCEVIGVWANALWPWLIPSIQDFVRCPDSMLIGSC
ncbi:uncharacterized protein LOC120189810 [Hibiscus syriacus]|uniref:uncharacterized protein LOC120189810 n=1 Tax=Hibiscus syriacus TaxID=106335 RepID=UPI00192284E8|nr:uncharacterized protein LOC120189810 [Hibiscus syriacus]